VTGRELLVKYLQDLMKAEGWRRPDGEWDIGALHKKVKGSRRWLYRVLRGETNFTIDQYERILQRGFGVPFEFVVIGLKTAAPLPRDVEDLQTALRAAIANAKQTGTIEGLEFALAALFDKAARDKALQEKTRPPSTPSGRGEEREAGTKAGSHRTKKHHG
jgi:transcriptional regulator with XRE-family HTH domain